MKGKASAFLKAISIGKYSTVLYTKQGITYKASVIGGIVTILLALTVGLFVIFQTVMVFTHGHLNL